MNVKPRLTVCGAGAAGLAIAADNALNQAVAQLASRIALVHSAPLSSR